jgi:hypothetical protein
MTKAFPILATLSIATRVWAAEPPSEPPGTHCNGVGDS